MLPKPAPSGDDRAGHIRIGTSEVSLATGELVRNGRVVPLGRRTLALLSVLVDAKGALVSNKQILDKVWQGRVVEQNTLQWQISSLRKALGADRSHLKTYSGRGYRIVASIGTSSEPVAQEPRDALGREDSEAEVACNLPSSPSALIGREDTLAELSTLLQRQRFVTLTGPGGIGKTRLALEVAWKSLCDFDGGAFFVDLSSIVNAVDVAPAIVSTIGIGRGSHTTLQARAKSLGSRPVLVVLDNCEHVIKVAATAAETIVRSNAVVTVLATSREPLRGDGEHLFPVPPLRLPSADFQPVASLLECGATQLFIDRSVVGKARYMKSSTVGEQIIKICRRLEGNPLAIELAAARADNIGIEEVAQRLENVLAILVDGKRTALPRHQTLRAMLAWSYELLSESERVLFRRLAVFAGGFTLASACRVVSNGEFSDFEALDLVSALVSKSLIAIDADWSDRRYRFLETTRAYALEMLKESGEFERVSAAHATYYLEQLDTAAFKTSDSIHEFALVSFRPEWDNARAALDWAFSDSGREELGIALASRVTPLMYEMLLLEQCITVASRALEASSENGGHDERMNLPTRTALACSLVYLRGPTEATVEVWSHVLKASRELRERGYEIRALWGLWTSYTYRGCPALAMQYALEYRGAADAHSSEQTAMLANRIVGVSHHYLGNHEDAYRHLNLSISCYVHGSQSLPLSNLIDHATLTRATLARVLWFLGFADRATDLVEVVVSDALAEDDPLAICYVTAECALPIALLAGDWAAARRYQIILRSAAERHGSTFWALIDRCYLALLDAEQAMDSRKLSVLRQAIDDLHVFAFDTYSVDLRNRLAHLLHRAGRMDEALALTNQTLDRIRQTDERLWEAEILRTRAMLSRYGDVASEAIDAEHDLAVSIRVAREQGALSLELRSSTDMARLMVTQGRRVEARTLLESVCGRFQEGHQTIERQEAWELIDSLR
ncbi:winged helix-turn-helix domain-containing protein [Variovorax sp. Sphag1AA]|uniref:ATP-binding protein n=1 Tax=Variovorax sp. Sphag1AA TaxID=2587027 RepID=UPI00160CF980|nr:winged helix-turn-helix domain-containing protein [Variovorax sp. Sphag1AA]MBB3178766.1 putative ATPase/DNA-binding winged helix-turn-helix (wHTH) protein [Variovorax sp. Sphag1AA]